MAEEKIEEGSESGKSTAGPIDRATHYFSLQGAREHRKKIIDRVGHDPNDTRGRTTDWGKVCGRVGHIGMFFAGGFAVQALDAIYSRTTRSERIIGAGNEDEEGTNWLNPQHVLASIEEADKDKALMYMGFIRRYFANCNVWEMLDEMENSSMTEKEFIEKSKAFREAAINLEQRLYKDGVEWQARVRSGHSRMEWIALLTSIAMTVIGGVNSLQPNTEEGNEASTDINAGQLFTGIAIAGTTKILSKHIGTVEKVAKGVGNVLVWYAAEIVKLRAKLEELRQKRGIADPSIIRIDDNEPGVIKAGLFANRYRPFPQESASSVFDAITTLRGLQGFEETAEALQLLSEPDRSAQLEALEEGHGAFSELKTLAKKLECPLFILSEVETEGEHYHLLNGPPPSPEEAEEHEDEKQQEEQDGAAVEPQSSMVQALQALGVRSDQATPQQPITYLENYLVLYSPTPGEYLPVVVPMKLGNRPQSFDFVQGQLRAIGNLGKQTLVLCQDHVVEEEAAATAASL